MNNTPPPGNGYASRGRGGYRGGFGSSSYSNHRYQPTNRWMNNKYIRPGLEGSSTSSEQGSQTASSSAGPSSTPAAAATSAPTSTSGKLSQGLLNGEVDNKGSGAVSTVPTLTTFGIGTKEVLIGGVAFESSARSLVRKDCMSFHSPLCVLCGLSNIDPL